MTFVAIDTLAGDSLMLSFTVTDKDGAPIDLSAATLRWGIKPKPVWKTACAPLVAKSSGLDANSNPLGITVIGNDNNVARVTINKGDVPAGNYIHELEVTLVSGDSFTAASGPFDAEPTVFSN